MPDNNIQLPQGQDSPWQDVQFPLTGMWIPDIDSTLIGPENFQTLENLRYKDTGVAMVNGYTKINTTSQEPITTYPKIKNGYHLRSNLTQTSYILAHCVSSGDQGRVYCNRTAPGSAGDFDLTSDLDVNGNEYFQDTATSLTGRFSEAPQENIIYCNGEESMIFGGDEQKVSACFTITETLGAEIITDSHNRDFSNTNEWVNDNMDAFNSSGDLTMTAGAYGDFCYLPQANAPVAVGNNYRIFYDTTAVAIENPGAAIRIGTGYGAGVGQIPVTATIQGSFDFVATNTGGIVIEAWKAVPSWSMDNFSLKQVTLVATDVTDKVQNTNHSSATTDMFTMDAAAANVAYVLTTRPIQALKIYVDSGNVNGTASSLTVKTWTGSGFGADIMNTDGTKSGGNALAQTGVVVLDNHTNSVAKPMHFEELYLYTYAIELSAGDADIYQITVDPAMQSIKNVWDGVYRQPIQFQVADATNSMDYTLQVNESSDLNAPVGALLDGLTTADKIYIMFEDQQSAIKFTMLGNKVNTNASLLSVQYWDGSQYVALSTVDETLDANNDTSFAKSGIVRWEVAGDEAPITLYGSFGYIYKFSLSGTLSGTKGGSGDNAEIVVDVCTGIPAQTTVKGFSWSALYGSRSVLGDYKTGNERNRLDYSVSNAPDVWNGFDSSDNGNQSLYFGGNTAIVAGTQIYNRFGASVYSMLLVLKYSEIYILVGDIPEEFIIYPVAKTIGCVAPKTLATTEIGVDLGNGLSRNVAIWLSHSGPMMFDGALLVPIRGIDSFFDPDHSNYVKFSLINTSVGWVDPNYKEYNLIIPSGSSASGLNKWLCYDLIRRKWFEKVPNASHIPQCGFEVISPTTGQRYIYAGKNDGYMVQLETGTVWDDGSSTGIAQKFKTGDFFATQNIWDETTLRKFILISKKVTEVSDVANTATISHYLNTDTVSHTVGTIDLSETVGTQQVARHVKNMNKTGWSHAIEGSVTTTNVSGGLQPLTWGLRYRLERKSDQAT